MELWSQAGLCGEAKRQGVLGMLNWRAEGRDDMEPHFPAVFSLRRKIQ